MYFIVSHLVKLWYVGRGGAGGGVARKGGWVWSGWGLNLNLRECEAEYTIIYLADGKGYVWDYAHTSWDRVGATPSAGSMG